MPSPLATYRCTGCWRAVQRVCDLGRVRRLWCGRCACTQTHARVRDRLVAPVWPPKAREEQP